MTKNRKDKQVSSSQKAALFVNKYQQTSSKNTFSLKDNSNEKKSIIDFISQDMNLDIKAIIVSVYKRDKETRLKSLKELKKMIPELALNQIQLLMPQWVHIYRSFSLNSIPDIEIAIQEINSQLSAHEDIFGLYLKKLFIPWFLCATSPSIPSHIIAKNAFDKFFITYSKIQADAFKIHVKNAIEFIAKRLDLSIKSKNFDLSKASNIAILDSCIHLLCQSDHPNSLQDILLSKDLLEVLLKSSNLSSLVLSFKKIISLKVISDPNLRQMTKIFTNSVYNEVELLRYQSLLELISCLILHNSKYVLNWNVSKTFWMKVLINLSTLTDYSLITYRWTISVFVNLKFDSDNFPYLMYSSVHRFVSSCSFDFIESFTLLFLVLIDICNSDVISEDNKKIIKYKDIFKNLFEFSTRNSYLIIRTFQVFGEFLQKLLLMKDHLSIEIKDSITEEIHEHFMNFISSEKSLADDSKVLDCWLIIYEASKDLFLSNKIFIKKSLEVLKEHLERKDFIIFYSYLQLEGFNNYQIPIHEQFYQYILNHLSTHNFSFLSSTIMDHISHIKLSDAIIFILKMPLNLSVKLLKCLLNKKAFHIAEELAYLLVIPVFESDSPIVFVEFIEIVLTYYSNVSKAISHLCSSFEIIYSKPDFLRNVISDVPLETLLSCMTFEEKNRFINELVGQDSAIFGNIHAKNMPLIFDGILNYVKEYSSMNQSNTTFLSFLLKLYMVDGIQEYVIDHFDQIIYLDLEKSINDQFYMICFSDIFEKTSVIPPDFFFTHQEDLQIRNFIYFIQSFFLIPDICVGILKQNMVEQFFRPFLKLYLLTDRANASLFVSRILTYQNTKFVPHNMLDTKRSNNIIDCLLFFELMKHYPYNQPEFIMDKLTELLSNSNIFTNSIVDVNICNVISTLMSSLKDLEHILLFFQFYIDKIGQNNSLTRLVVFNSLFANFLDIRNNSPLVQEIVTEIINYSHVLTDYVSKSLSLLNSYTDLLPLLFLARNLVRFSIDFSCITPFEKIVENILTKFSQFYTNDRISSSYFLCICEIQNIYLLLFTSNRSYYNLDRIPLNTTILRAKNDVSSFRPVHFIMINAIKSQNKRLLKQYIDTPSDQVIFLFLSLFEFCSQSIVADSSYEKLISELVKSKNMACCLQYFSLLNSHSEDSTFYIIKVDDQFDYTLNASFENAIISILKELSLHLLPSPFIQMLNKHNISKTLCLVRLICLTLLILKDIERCDLAQKSMLIENSHLKDLICQILAGFFNQFDHKKLDRNLIPSTYLVTTDRYSVYCVIFYLILRILSQFPSLLNHVISIYTSCSGRYKQFSKVYLCKSIANKQIQNCLENFQNDDFLKVSHQIGLNQLEVLFSRNDENVDIIISFPEMFPIHPVKVEPARKGFSKTKNIMQDINKLQLLILAQRGSLCDALEIWKQNIIKRLDGIEACSICYSILQTIDCSMPNVACSVCRKSVHKICLMNWFKSSGKKLCPNCRSNFY